MAVSMIHLDYVAHSCVQALLNDVWTGSIKNLDITTRNFLLAMVFPPYLMTFDFRNESELKNMVQTTADEPVTVVSLSMALPSTIKFDSSDSGSEDGDGKNKRP